MRKWTSFCTFLFLTLGAQSVTAEVEATDAWVRLLPPNVANTAAYVELLSDRPDRLIKVSSDIASKIELHNSTMEDGMMSMFEVDYIELLPNEIVKLAPHGYHMMVMGLNQALKEGQLVEFTLEFEQAGQKKIQAKVQRNSP